MEAVRMNQILTPTIMTKRQSSLFKKGSLFKVKPKIHFKSLVKLILECQRLIAAYSLKNKNNDEIMPYIQDMTFHFEVSTPLLFDPSDYKADKQLRVPEDIKTILRKDNNLRSKEELKLVEIYLKGIDTVREYPIRMQEQIAKFGDYEKYDCKRILIRQGHRASSFYIILSGSVAIIVMNAARTKGSVVTNLIKGQSFGELAIINKSSRQSTVIAKETVELLSISIKNFHEIFMSGGIKMIMDPDHDDFIRNSFLSDFSPQLLTTNTDKFIFQYFRNNEILSRDTNNSRWIYLVKSGEISVIFLEKIVTNKIMRPKSSRSQTARRENTTNTPAFSDDTVKSLCSGSSENEKIHDEKEVPEKETPNRQHIRTIAEDFDLAYDNVENSSQIFQNYRWIQIQRIRKNDVFGLIQCLFPNQPRFLLVSRGVEVFMMDKCFFMTNCSDKTQLELSITMASYPSVQELQKTIQEQRNWKIFKEKTLNKCLSNLKLKKKLH